jgi:urate oxidase
MTAPVQLGANRYGKAAVRLVKIDRDTTEHRITEFTVASALAGDLASTHLTGDNSAVLPTDTQKNTVYAFAKEYGVGEPEDFGLLLGRHYVKTQEAIHTATITITQHFWDGLALADGPAPHSFARSGAEVRRTVVTVTEDGAWVRSGLTGLTLLNSTDSEFHGFPVDQYTTLNETDDRILATAVDAWWRHDTVDVPWGASYTAARQALLHAFATTHSLSLQQTLYAIGTQVITDCPSVAEVRLTLPNKHHFLVDLTPFGLENPGEVFVATEEPHGLIEGTILRAGTPSGPTW